MLRTALIAIALLTACGAAQAGSHTKSNAIQGQAVVESTKHGQPGSRNSPGEMSDYSVGSSTSAGDIAPPGANRATPPLPVRPNVALTSIADASASHDSGLGCRRYVPAASMTIAVPCTR